ncbi:MAG TPA: hypothetical protein VMV05_06500 [bacterium]|nr:hypothetical protein [bacterium]
MTEAILSPKLRQLLREKIRLSPGHCQTLYAVTGLVWLSGALWLLVEKLSGQGESSWSPLLLKIHGAAAIGFSILLGTMLVHIRRGLALKRNLRSGLFLIGVNLFLVATGWLLYYAGGDNLRNVASLAHWGIGLGLPIFLVVHIWLGRESARKKP